MGDRERMKSRLRENPTLTREELHDLLDAYQVATGHSTGVEGLRALMELLSEGRPLYLVSSTAPGEARTLRSHDDLAVVIAAYDASIDLRNDEELRGYYRAKNREQPPSQGQGP